MYLEYTVKYIWVKLWNVWLPSGVGPGYSAGEAEQLWRCCCPGSSAGRIRCQVFCSVVLLLNKIYSAGLPHEASSF